MIGSTNKRSREMTRRSSKLCAFSIHIRPTFAASADWNLKFTPTFYKIGSRNGFHSSPNGIEQRRAGSHFKFLGQTPPSPPSTFTYDRRANNVPKAIHDEFSTQFITFGLNLMRHSKPMYLQCVRP